MAANLADAFERLADEIHAECAAPGGRHSS